LFEGLWEGAEMPSVIREGQQPTLAEFLVQRARRASDGRLALDVAVGCVAAMAVILWQPTGWLPLSTAAVALAAFGSWGIADRVLTERLRAGAARTLALRAIRVVSAAVGVAAAVALSISMLGLALGTWIS
jgi:hypothetical protein